MRPPHIFFNGSPNLPDRVSVRPRRLVSLDGQAAAGGDAPIYPGEIRRLKGYAMLLKLAYALVVVGLVYMAVCTLIVTALLLAMA